MSWFLKISADERLNSDYIEQLARQNPRPFAKWFSQGDREYISLGSPAGVDPEIEQFVKDEGCQISDYRGGYGLCGKRVFRIGKLLEQARKRDLNQLQQRLQSGELYDIERDIKSTNDYYDGLVNTFTNSQFRVSRESSLMVVISQNPYDIAYMSTGRDWTSCMEIGKGSHHQDVYCEVKEGGLIAYLVRSNDKEIKKPLARVLIKRFVNANGDSVAIPEQTVYGNAVEGFETAVKQWIESKQGTIAPGYYKRQGGEWSDTFPKNMLVAPTIKTQKDQQEVLKWLRMQQPLVHTEWIVTDNLAEYSENPERETESFKTEKEAQEYVNRMSADDWEEEDIRERIDEDGWKQKDEEGNWAFPRYTVRKKEKDFSSDMQRQAIQEIIKADKGVFPIEVIQEIKQIFNEKYRKMNDRDLWVTFLNKYPELFTEEEYKDMGEDKFLNYIIKLPDDSIKKQQVRQQYLQQTSQFLQNPQTFYNAHLKEAIRNYRMSSAVNERANYEDSMNLFFNVSFSDAVIGPIESLFTKDHQGTQKPTPIPNDTVKELVNFCMNLPNYPVFDEKPFDPVKLNKRHLVQNFAKVVHLFNMSGTDTPDVQQFYKWLADNWYSDGLNEDYSSINVETLGSAIASLGENGWQFIPWAQQKLNEAQQTFNKFNEEHNRPSDFHYRRAKLNVERFLYIVDALVKGKPSGKYRFYSRKNWWKIAVGAMI